MREDATTVETKSESKKPRGGLLVLGRRTGQTIRVNGPAVIRVIETRDGRVKLGIEAPATTLVLRGELEVHEPKEHSAEELPEAELLRRA